MTEIDNTILGVERLYRSVTGREPPAMGDTPHAPIPPEIDPARHVEAQIDRLVGALGGLSLEAQTSPAWVPEVSLWEGGDQYLFCVDLPGVERETLEVTLEGAALVVSGERRPPVADDGRTLRPHTVERRHGTFRRVILLPKPVNAEELKARVRDGVLEIRLPRPSAADSRRRLDIS